MSRYQYDPSKASASIEVFPKDDYEFIVGKPKSFAKVEGDSVKNFGVRFALTIADGQFKDKKTVFTCYLHNDGGQSMTKRFQMACLGYGKGKAEEDKFDLEQTGKDWDFDPESGECGEAWNEMAGARIVGSLDVGKNTNNDEPQQQFKAWRPIGAAQPA